MNCQEFDQRIQQLLDDRASLTGDSELHAHALRCSNCEEIIAAYGSLLRGTNQLPRPVVGPKFALQVVKQATAEPVILAAGGGSSPRARHWAPLAAAAALVLLAVGLGTWANLNKARTGGGGEIVDSRELRPGKAGPARGVVGIVVPGPVGKTPEAAPGRAGQPPFSTPLQPEMAAYPVPAARSGAEEEFYGYRISIHSLAMQLPGAVGQFNAVEEYAPGIRPIRESFSTALETLRRTFPGQPDQPATQPPQARIDGSHEITIA